MTTFGDVEEELHIFLTFAVGGVDIFIRRSAAKEFPYPFTQGGRCGVDKNSILLRTFETIHIPRSPYCSLVSMLTELYKLAKKQEEGTKTNDYISNDTS